MKDSKQIILLISERSGSNLMRTLIGNHKRVCAPPPPHLAMEFYPIRKFYDDLRDDKNKMNLLTDMLGLVNHPYHDWKLDESRVLNTKIDEVNSIISAIDHIYRAKTKSVNKQHYCSKGIHAFDYIDQYRSELKNVKFIHLVRDPRDHVASWLKRPINKFTAFDAIQQWKKEQAIFIDALSTRGLDCISVRYEDLIADTPSVMTKVLDYLEIEKDERCFQTDPKNVESKRNEYWQNLSKPVMKDNAKKYKKQLSLKEILIIESITKREMEFFNYEFDTMANWSPTLLDVKELKKERKIKIAENKKNPKSDIDLLLQKWAFLKELKGRLKKGYVNDAINLPEEQLSLKDKIKKSVKIFLR